MTAEMKSLLQLVYSLCKQYIAWYEREIKTKGAMTIPVSDKVYATATDTLHTQDEK